MEAMKVDHEDTVVATVVPSGDETVLLWDESNREVSVKEKDVQYWIDLGFSRVPRNLFEYILDIDVYFDAAKRTVSEYVRGVAKDGLIDTSDEAAYASSLVAMAKLNEVFLKVHQVISRSYPVSQDDGVEMVHAETEEVVTVDPGQVDAYKELNYVNK